jgi:hypothetical protein
VAWCLVYWWCLDWYLGFPSSWEAGEALGESVLTVEEMFVLGFGAFGAGWFFALLTTLLLDLGYALIEMIGDIFWH